MAADDVSLLRALVERAPVAMGVNAPDGRFIMVNAACADFFGLSMAEMLHTRWQDLTEDDTLPEELQFVTEIMSGERESYRLTKPFRLKHAQLRWGDLSVSCVRAADGQVRFLIGQIVDVTAAESSRLTLESTLASMLDPHVLLHVDRAEDGALKDVRFVGANEQAAEDLHCPLGKLVGASVRDVLPETGAAEFVDFIGRVSHSPVPVIADDVPRIHPITGAEYWIDIRVVVVDDGISFTWRDVTQRHLAEQELAAREGRYRLLAENVTDVIVRSGIDGRIEYVSPSVAAFDWSVEELQGCALTELIHPDDLGALRRAHDEAISSGSDEGRVTLRLRTGSGDWRWMSDHGRPVRDEGGSVVGVIDSFRDVQAEHDASEELRRGSEILRGVIDSLSDPWVLLEAVRDESGSIVDMVFVDANEAAGEHNRVSREDIVGARLLAIAPEHGPSGIFERYVRVVESGLTLVEDDVAFTHPVDGEVGWFDNRAVKVGDGISLTWRDVTDRYLRRRELEEQTERDLLTGVANRLQLERRLAQVVGGHRRLASLVAVLYLDLDNFKEINDSLGHAAGDGVLTTVAARIRQALRETDLVARVGGDEFVVILDAISTVEDAQSTAQKVASAIGTPIRSGTMSITPLASIGVAIVGKGQTADEAIAAADHAMYQAKRQGRNRIVVAG